MSAFAFSLSATSFLHKDDNSSLIFCNFSRSAIFKSVTKRTKPFTFRCSSAPTSPVGYAVSTDAGICDDSWTKDQLDISKLDISEKIVSALARREITELFPIQRAVLEPAMEGRDIIGRAITGSGKTLAFGIPILDKISRLQSQQSFRQKRIPSALVLAPTRELARQVYKEFKDSAPNLNSVCLYGGIPIMNQTHILGFGVDIAVGTPGRIIDLVERGALNLSEVKFVVLDEADQMLAVGFQDDVESILGYLPAKKQCMLFSATMPSWVNDISRKYLRNPLVIDLVNNSNKKLAEGISLYSVPSTSFGKIDLLPTLISRFGKGGKCIVFTKTKKDAEALSRSTGIILGSRALHGNMQQFQRDRTIAAFRDGRFDILVATDVAARGLDIPNVDLVIHLEIPNTPEIFVHRSGRTGRAGKKGTAVLIFTESQRHAVRLIERELRFKFEELPRNVNGVGNNVNISEMGAKRFGRHKDSERGFLHRACQFTADRNENFGGRGRQNYISSYERNTWDSKRIAQREQYGSGYGNSRRNRYSENLGARNMHSVRSRSSHFYDYDDLDSNSYSNNATPSMNNMGSFSRSPKFHFDGHDASKNSSGGGGHSRAKQQSSFDEIDIDFKQIIESLSNHT